MPLEQPRAGTLASLKERPLDILVVGGGIVGSGIARDAAMRGLRVGLVEQHDFAFGTSSRSSRLLHGGMRYLAQGRLGLVREASVEKKIIHEIAPHLSEPLPFVFPGYAGNRDWVLWQLKIGVKIYDLLCGGRNLGKSTWLSRAAVLERVPLLQPTGLKGAVRYFDGFTNDARLVLDTVRSAVRSGALAINYCRFKDADKAGPENGTGHGPSWTCHLADQLTGQEFYVRAQTIVNATGPWAGGLPHSQVKLRITKGIHAVVERARLPVPDTVVMTEGKRILFAIPWGERTILGTTDTDYRGSLEDVNVEPADIDYVLSIANKTFPSAWLDPQDVISVWAGLRPLIADPNGKPSDISRSHQIRNPEPGWWDVAGGKLTTYRLMAEQTVDEIVQSLSRLGIRVKGPCRTAKEPLLPQSETQNISGILPPVFSRAIVEHHCAHEWAVHLDDLMLRRTGWYYYHRDSSQMAERAADWMGELFGWSKAQRSAELERYGRVVGTGPAQGSNPPCRVTKDPARRALKAQ